MENKKTIIMLMIMIGITFFVVLQMIFSWRGIDITEITLSPDEKYKLVVYTVSQKGRAPKVNISLLPINQKISNEGNVFVANDIKPCDIDVCWVDNNYLIIKYINDKEHIIKKIFQLYDIEVTYQKSSAF